MILETNRSSGVEHRGPLGSTGNGTIMRVLVLSMNYAPEMTAVAPFTTGLCEHLARSGHQVRVITTFAHYPEWRVWDRYRNQIRNRTVVNDVSILRIWHFVPRHPGSLFRRLLYDLSFTFGSFVAGLFAAKCERHLLRLSAPDFGAHSLPVSQVEGCALRHQIDRFGLRRRASYRNREEKRIRHRSRAWI